MPIKLKKLAELSWTETVNYYATLLGARTFYFSPLHHANNPREPIPAAFVVLKAILSLPFVDRSGKTKLRYIHDNFLRFAVDSFNAPQFQKFLGPDEGVYRGWAKVAKVEPVIETIPDSGGIRIFWIGGKPEGMSTSRVIVYLHGTR